MADFTSPDCFFDFDAASNDTPANEVGPKETELRPNLSRGSTGLPDQHHQMHNTTSPQAAQQEDQMPVITDPSPAIAPPSAVYVQRPWAAYSSPNQNVSSGQFTYGNFTAAVQPVLQQTGPATPEANIQQQQHSQSTGHIHHLYRKPPAHCNTCTNKWEEWEQICARTSLDPNTGLHLPIHQQHLISFPPSTQRQNIPLPPNVYQQPSISLPPSTQRQNIPLSPNIHLGRHPAHLALASPRTFPQGPSRPITDRGSPIQLVPPRLAPIRQHHQAFNYAMPPMQHQPPTPPTHDTPPRQQQSSHSSYVTTWQQHAASHGFTPPMTPPSPTEQAAKPTTTFKPLPFKGCKPTGITKRKNPVGRPRKDRDPSVWHNESVPENLHTNTTMWGRSNFRSEARMSEPWNQPDVKGKGNGKGKGKEEERDGESQAPWEVAVKGKGKEKVLNEEGQLPKQVVDVVKDQGLQKEPQANEPQSLPQEAVNNEASVPKSVAEMAREIGMEEQFESLVEFVRGVA